MYILMYYVVIDGKFSGWSGWGSCSATCGGGKRFRTRRCDNPPPANGGTDCLEARAEYETCNTQWCAGDGGTYTYSPMSNVQTMQLQSLPPTRSLNSA